MKRISFVIIVFSALLLSNCKTLYLNELTPVNDGCGNFCPL